MFIYFPHYHVLKFWDIHHFQKDPYHHNQENGSMVTARKEAALAVAKLHVFGAYSNTRSSHLSKHGWQPLSPSGHPNPARILLKSTCCFGKHMPLSCPVTQYSDNIIVHLSIAKLSQVNNVGCFFGNHDNCFTGT
jgi:hypothetical protein